MRILNISMPGTHHHPAEDAMYCNDDGTVLAVADGVTRSVGSDGRYPDPSPARMAADAFCQTVRDTLTGSALVDEEEMSQAFDRANAAIGLLNKELGLAEKPDYNTRDLAGTVAAIAVRDGLRVTYGYIGDCGVAVLDSEGGLKWQTQDDVAIAAEHFPRLPDSLSEDRQVIVRREYRNKPRANFPTYGVLTGEPGALSYVKTGTMTIMPGDILVVFSDGTLPLLRREDTRSLIMSLRQADLKRYIETLRREQNEAARELSLLAVAV